MMYFFHRKAKCQIAILINIDALSFVIALHLLRHISFLG